MSRLPPGFAAQPVLCFSDLFLGDKLHLTNLTVPLAALRGWMEALLHGVGGCHAVVESGCHVCGEVICACGGPGRDHDVLVQLSGGGVGEEGHGGDALARLSDGGVGEEGHGGVHDACDHE